MSTIHHSRSRILSIAAVLAFALLAPVAVNAEEQGPSAAPAAPSWDDTSGYGAVESSRAAASTLRAADPSWDDTSGYSSVEAIRAGASALLAPAAITNQVPSDVRWAPARAIEADLSSGRGFPRSAEGAAAREWDDTSGYGVVEASRAAAAGLITSPDATRRYRDQALAEPAVTTDTLGSACSPGVVVQTVTVPPDESVVQTTSLDRGQPYRLRVSGVLTSNVGTKAGLLAMDADYLVFARDGAFAQGPDRLAGVDIGLAMTDGTNAEPPSPTWGAFDPTHGYAREVVGHGQPLTLRVQNPEEWTYVGGELTVEIVCA